MGMKKTLCNIMANRTLISQLCSHSTIGSEKWRLPLFWNETIAHIFCINLMQWLSQAHQGDF